VLRLRASYLEHEFKEPLPKDRFSVNLGLRLNVSLHDFLPHLLEHERHWAAENVLEMCFRKSGNKSHRIELTAIWHSIKDFVTMDVLENNEETVWAQIAILQTFCEGTLRRQQLQLPKGQGTDIWKQSKHIMAQLLQKLNNCSSGHHWIRSRACMRQKLIELDYSILKRTAESDHSVTGEDLETLNSLKAQAASSFDIRLGDVTQWRIEILAACKDPQYISVPAAFPVPERLYAKRQKLVDSIEESERMNRATKCQEWWTTISSSRSDLDGQDAMSMTSGERAHRCLDKPDVPVTKRVLLMGYVGTGKSTLLRTLTNKYAATSNRRACTQVLQRETCQMADGSMVECIDTPGFGDPDIADYTNLRKICEYLKAEAKANRCLHSVFYLINLGNNRLDKSTVQLAKLFKEIVGPDVWRNVCFIYTCGVNPKLAETDRGSRRELKEQKRRANLDYAELFGEAKVSGAHFADLGLDNSDCTILIAEPALSAQHDINVAQDGQKSEDDEGHTHVDSSGEGDDGGRSNESYQPADRNQGTSIEPLLYRRNILTSCSHEDYRRDDQPPGPNFIGMST
jgi:GTP-binding protein EngB required for normal cell division